MTAEKTKQLTYKDRLTPEAYNALRVSVGWGPLCQEQAERTVANSAYLISCFDGEKVVGAARLLWDGGYIAFLADVMVLPDYQSRGIGRHMVTEAIEFIKAQLRDGWRIKIVLTASKGKESFYRPFGFVERPNARSGACMDLWLPE